MLFCRFFVFPISCLDVAVLCSQHCTVGSFLSLRNCSRTATRNDQAEDETRKPQRQEPKNNTSSPISCPRTTQDTKKDGRDEGLKHNDNQTNQMATKTNKPRVKQPTRRGRVRGGAIDEAGNRETRRTKSGDSNTASSSCGASQLERRPVPRFGGSLHLFNPA